jgi:hypothetical protein
MTDHRDDKATGRQFLSQPGGGCPLGAEGVNKLYSYHFQQYSTGLAQEGRVQCGRIICLTYDLCL